MTDGRCPNAVKSFVTWVDSQLFEIALQNGMWPANLEYRVRRNAISGKEEIHVSEASAKLLPRGSVIYLDLLNDMRNLHLKKSEDYSSSDSGFGNFEEVERLGLDPGLGIMVRMTDKYSRLCNLIAGHSPNFESIEDNAIDLAAYALLLVAQRRYSAEKSKPSLKPL